MATKPFRELIQHPMAWRSRDLVSKETFSRQLGADHLLELDEFVARTRNRPVEDISHAEIQAPKLLEFMDSARDQVMSGLGLIVITGADLQRYSRDEFERISWALGLYFGLPISQSVFGERIAHVRQEAHNPSGRGYRTNRELTCHTDTPDVLGLMCIQTAKSGGLSTVVSALALHNEFVAKYPHHLEPLYRGFPFYRLGQELPGQGTVSEYDVPIFCNVKGVVSCMYVPHLLRKAQEPLGRVMPSDLQAAMARFDELCLSPEFSFSFAFERGDIFFINNRTLLHSRTTYEDHDDPELKRDLLRLWIDVPKGRRSIVDEMDPYQQPGSGGRGGVMRQAEKQAA
jgi:hypothetical protein